MKECDIINIKESLIDESVLRAVEQALEHGERVQLKKMKDGTVKAQIVAMKDLSTK